jgi:SAM-dependent methyltransferase
MALEWTTVCLLEGKGFFRPGIAVLDIGSSNVYNGEDAGIAEFIRMRQPQPDAAIEGLAADIGRRSRMTLDGQQQNKAFLGEILTAAGLGYESIDIADGYRTTLLDLNRDALPKPFAGAFDLVMNVGTSEHVLDQAAVFRLVHEATRPGGLMFHQLPAAGFANHGYYCYTPRLFCDLAGYNGYEIVEMWFDGPSAHDALLSAVKSYRHIYPALDDLLVRADLGEKEATVGQVLVPDISINLLYRRKSNAPFVGALEMSTSVGPIDQSTLDAYSAVPRTARQRAVEYIHRDYPRLAAALRRIVKRRA